LEIPAFLQAVKKDRLTRVMGFPVCSLKNRWGQIPFRDFILSNSVSWNNFSSDGSFNTVTYTIEANTVSFSGASFQGEKQYKIRGSVVFAPDLMSSVEKGEVSADGKTWIPSYENRWTKTKSSPK